MEMKAVSAQVESCCVYVKPKKLYSTCMALFHTCLTVGQLFISFYQRAQFLDTPFKGAQWNCTVLWL